MIFYYIRKDQKPTVNDSMPSGSPLPTFNPD